MVDFFYNRSMIHEQAVWHLWVFILSILFLLHKYILSRIFTFYEFQYIIQTVYIPYPCISICIWYIPSEKIGQFFWPPRNGFFGINYHQWTWGNAFWPFLAPPDPWGGSRGVWGGQGGSRGPKIVTFLGATFGLQIGKFWIVWTENTPFSSFLAKFSPSGDQKCPFWAEMVEHKSAFFSKTSSLNCLKMHQNKVLGSILI